MNLFWSIVGLGGIVLLIAAWRLPHGARQIADALRSSNPLDEKETVLLRHLNKWEQNNVSVEGMTWLLMEMHEAGQLPAYLTPADLHEPLSLREKVLQHRSESDSAP